MTISLIANLLAADLAGARVDPNEAQKALAYLRSKKDGKQFFEYLLAINQNGRAVIRSGQTLGYYRDLLAACERHLRSFQDQPDEMVDIFAWAIRLLRYYRAVPDAVELMHQDQSLISHAAVVSSPKAVTTTLPVVGFIFAGKVNAVDETAVLIEIPDFSEDKAIGLLKAEVIEGGRTNRYRVGNAARVEVMGVRTLKSGRVIVELKPVLKK